MKTVKNKKTRLPITKYIRAYGRKTKFSKAQLICITVTAVMSLLAAFVSGKEHYLGADGSIDRAAPGGSDKIYELIVGGIDKGTSRISVNVSPREFGEDEAEAICEELMENLSLYICGDNTGLDELRYDLKLKRSIPGYNGVRISWYPEDPELISDSGKLNNYGLEEAVDTVITVVLKAGEYRSSYALPVTVYPADAAESDPQELKELLGEAINNADEEQKYDSRIILPKEIAGRVISYTEPKSAGWIKIAFMGIFATVLLGLKPEQDRRKRIKERERELMLDYSDIVSKLAIYIGAGMTVSNAWCRIGDNYLDSLAKGITEPRAAYEELVKTSRELRQGVAEQKAYSDFAGRCSLSSYLKLVSLLEQNRKTGDSRLRLALLQEAREAFDQRKNTARQLGEEAGTKLMLPLIISLITVMITVAVPAMMTLL